MYTLSMLNLFFFFFFFDREVRIFSVWHVWQLLLEPAAKIKHLSVLQWECKTCVVEKYNQRVVRRIINGSTLVYESLLVGANRKGNSPHLKRARKALHCATPPTFQPFHVIGQRAVSTIVVCLSTF